MNRSAASRTHAPRQARSRDTLERLLDAAEQLLEQSLFDQLPISEIARRAGVSVGNFYNRFPDKAALLEEVYERHERVRGKWFADRLAPERWSGDPLPARVQALAGLLVRYFTARPGLIRSFVMYRRTHKSGETPAMRERSQAIFDSLVALILGRREEIRHPDPEAAARMAVFVLLASCRDRLVFGKDPQALALRFNRALFGRELARLAAAYLGLPEVSGPPPAVRRRTKRRGDAKDS